MSSDLTDQLERLMSEYDKIDKALNRMARAIAQVDAFLARGDSGCARADERLHLLQAARAEIARLGEGGE